MAKATSSAAQLNADLESSRGGTYLMCWRADGVGPQITDERCDACGGIIYATGECRCSD